MGRIVREPPGAARPTDSMVVGGWWHETDAPGRIVCDVCPRQCVLKPGARGFCFVRQNVDGQLVLTTYGRSTGFCVDPIEKKPLNHFYPGTSVLSFGTAGCNLGCKFCQNWDISKSREVERLSEIADPETVAHAAGKLGCRSVAFTYNDPIIWAEYAIDTAKACHRRGIKTVAVTSGYITPDARESFFSVMDAANIDLKAITEQFYFELAYAHLQPVLDCLAWLKRETDVWFEITNLVIPQANDSADELRRLCDWVLTHVGDEVPVHFTAFHPAFRLQDRSPTPHETLLEAYATARQQGLHYVYLGNVHDPEHDSTYCPYCNTLLIQRDWHQLRVYRMRGDRCPGCNGQIAGRFEAEPGRWGARRLPIRIADYQLPAAARTPDSDAVHGDGDGGQIADPGPAVRKEANGLSLTREQMREIHAAATELVTAAVNRRPASLSDPTLAGAADRTVMGAFVTLKRGTHLRACRGVLGRPMRLGDAVRDAALQTATDDQRLPPISPTEIPYLTLDVSVLHDFQQLSAAGADRVKVVEVGRHGLTIQRGQAGGLLLPSVPVENGWDAEAFLRQLCRKAGLPSTAWLDDEATLQTFEACVIEPSPDVARVSPADGHSPALLTTAQIESLQAHCHANIRALVAGATPNYYVPNCPDATVQGVALTIDLAAANVGSQFARLSLRPGLPLQATLFQLCEAAARWLGSQRVAVDAIETGLMILHDSAMHGTVAEPDLRGVDPVGRALLVVDQQRSAWIHDVHLKPEQQLARAAREAEVLSPRTAAVFSFAAESTRDAMTIVNVPRAESGPPERAPAVVGTFYPQEPDALDQLVDQFVHQTSSANAAPWSAVLVPHAGLRFSGQLAAATLSRVVFPERMIILAPKHTHHGVPWAVAPHTRWVIPGHVVSSDTDLARQLAAGIAMLQLDAAAHREEHAIEVQLPILARLAPRSRVVGITVGGGDWDACQRFADGLADVVRAQVEPPLLVISTDLNHYASEAENRRLDKTVIEALRTLDPKHLYDTVRDHGISMCGILPAVIVLSALRRLDQLHEVELVGYTTSADVTGNTQRVVGYTGMLFR